ncbi:MAG: PQQ-binding-like beta-propeller repeat protein [Gammaproteobacteria bacterium]|nr:PQQ-binding-like beta-propeller repeat protein [Gammaproteobacteria bacterium]
MRIARLLAPVGAILGFVFPVHAADGDRDWPLYGLDYGNTRYSALAAIDRGNVAKLVPRWSYHTGMKDTFQATPIVVDGTMYVSTPWNHVVALDAATGKERWHYEHPIEDQATCCGPANRGVAVGDGLVYMATLDAHVVALDAKTGTKRWETPLADKSTAGSEQLAQLLGERELEGAKQTGHTGITANMAPQIVDGLVLAGVTGAGYGLHVEIKEKGETLLSVAGLGGENMGLRGFLVALDAKTGREVWRWYVVPEHGWEGAFVTKTADGAPLDRDVAAERAAFERYPETWRYGGGSVWTTPAIDRARGLLYLGTGNPAPQMDDSTRPGDNLNTISLVALELKTGKLRWAYQQVPHDRWGYDVASPPVLTTVTVNGKPREVVGEASKTGWFYLHDRDTGELVLKSEAFVPQQNLFKRPTPDGVLIQPSAYGACSWSPAALDAAGHRAYVAGIHHPAFYYSRKLEPQPGRPWTSYTFFKPEAGTAYGLLSAIDLESGRIAWQTKTPQPLLGGVLATAGGLLFTGEGNGEVSAFDAGDGRKLWSHKASAGANAPPVTYRVGGTQYVAIAAGGNLLYGYATGDEIIAFALPGDTAKKP